MNRPRLPMFLAVAIILVGLLLPVWAAGAQPTVLRLDAKVIEGIPDELSIELLARLAQADGKPIGNRDIKFYIRTQEFGDRLLPLGTTKSDSGGSATLKYAPTWAGEQQFVARFAGDSEHAAGERFAMLQVPLARSPYQKEAEPLMAVRKWVPLAAGAAVVTVWGVLFWLLFGVLRGLPRGAAEQPVGHDLGTKVGYGE